MKNRNKANFFKTLALIMLGITIIQCSSEEENNDQTETTLIQQEVSLETISKLELIGFNMDNTSVEVTEGGYIVGGDIFFSEESLDDSNFQKQSYRRLVSCNRVSNIRIENRLGNNAAGRGFQRGINLWNNVSGTTLRLIPVTNNPDIIVRLARPNEIGGWGLGQFPSNNGREGRLIRINLNEPSIDGDPVTSREWGNIIAHEIGHNIGFLHAQEDFGSFTEFVPGSIANDPQSIMNDGGTPEVVFNANNLSRGDIIAVRRMYSNRNNRLCR